MIPAVGAPGKTRTKAESAAAPRTARRAPSPAEEAETLLEAAESELGDASQAAGEIEPPALAAETSHSAEPEARVDCPLCGSVGSLSLAPRRSERYQTCEECAGHGMVLSGSLVDEAILLPCESCSGRGYVADPAYRAHLAELSVGRFPNPSPPNPPAPGMEWDSSLGMWAYPRAQAG